MHNNIKKIKDIMGTKMCRLRKLLQQITLFLGFYTNDIMGRFYE